LLLAAYVRSPVGAVGGGGTASDAADKAKMGEVDEVEGTHGTGEASGFSIVTAEIISIHMNV
jgi:hypothetical protein